MILTFWFNFFLFTIAIAQFYDQYDSADEEPPSSQLNGQIDLSESEYSIEKQPIKRVLKQESTRSNECGKGNFTFVVSRIIGGARASLGDWPWAAAIYINNRFVCGGTLINHNFILTAAHCIINPEKGGKRTPTEAYSIRLGDLSVGANSNAKKSITLKLKKVIPHPNFRISTLHNDIAVMQLERSVKFNDYVYPACLPLKSEENLTFERTGAILTGWGTVGFEREPSNYLLYVPLPIQPLEVCIKAYKTYSKAHPIIPSQLCAGVLTGKRDGCQGDSGGPLVVMDPYLKDAPWTVVGVVSYGYKCAEAGFPGIYTRVTSFLDWIENNTKY